MLLFSLSPYFWKEPVVGDRIIKKVVAYAAILYISRALRNWAKK